MIPNPTDFDEILDGCLLEVTAGRSSVEDCLSRYPQVAAQLEPLLRSAARVYALPRPSGLAAEKRRAIEQQLLSRAAQSKAPATPRRPIASARRSLRLRFGLAALVAVLLLVGGTGAMTASTASLPDDLL